MKPHVIDHVVAHVPDLEQASQHVERLGFRLSPVSHLDNVGVVNRLVLFPSGDPACASFFELMQPTMPASRLHPAMAAVLGGTPAWRWFVLAAGDAGALQRELEAKGVAMPAPVHVRREWQLPHEPSVWPEFDVTFPCDAELPFNVCRYHNVQLYQRADWTQHPNGADQLLAIVAVVADPSATARRYADWLGSRAIAGPEGSWTVQGEPTALELWPAGAFRGRYPQVTAKPGYRGIRVRAPGARRVESLFPVLDGFIEWVPPGG